MTVLTSRERLDRCFKHLELDRPGLYIRGVDQKNPAHESYKPLRELVVAKGDMKFVFFCSSYKDITGRSYREEPFNEDFERHITTIHTSAGDLNRVYMHGLNGQPGYTEKYFIETPEEAEIYLSLPETGLSFNSEDFFELDRKIGDRGIAIADLGLNPAGTVADLIGSERFALWSIEYRDILHRLIEREQRVLSIIVRQLLDKGIGPYFALLGQEYIVPPLHGPSDFYDFNVRYDKPILDMIHNSGGYVHVHCHGPIKSVLHYFVEMGADVLHPIEAPPMGNISIKEAKNILRGKVCIEGNIQIGDMYDCNASQIKEMTLEIIKDGFDDFRDLTLCPTASPFIPIMTPRALENYTTLINTVLDYKL